MTFMMPGGLFGQPQNESSEEYKILQEKQEEISRYVHRMGVQFNRDLFRFQAVFCICGPAFRRESGQPYPQRNCPIHDDIDLLLTGMRLSHEECAE